MLKTKEARLPVAREKGGNNMCELGEGREAYVGIIAYRGCIMRNMLHRKRLGLVCSSLTSTGICAQYFSRRRLTLLL